LFRDQVEPRIERAGTPLEQQLALDRVGSVEHDFVFAVGRDIDSADLAERVDRLETHRLGLAGFARFLLELELRAEPQSVARGIGKLKLERVLAVIGPTGKLAVARLDFRFTSFDRGAVNFVPQSG